MNEKQNVSKFNKNEMNEKFTAIQFHFELETQKSQFGQI